MQDKVQKLKEFMESKGLTQAELAKKAGVDQSTVSRILRSHSGVFERYGKARQKLITYMDETYDRKEIDSGRPQMKVLAAFNQIWDRTEAHADAVAKVIQSLADLEPKK